MMDKFTDPNLLTVVVLGVSGVALMLGSRFFNNGNNSKDSSRESSSSRGIPDTGSKNVKNDDRRSAKAASMAEQLILEEEQEEEKKRAKTNKTNPPPSAPSPSNKSKKNKKKKKAAQKNAAGAAEKAEADLAAAAEAERKAQADAEAAARAAAEEAAREEARERAKERARAEAEEKARAEAEAAAEAATKEVERQRLMATQGLSEPSAATEDEAMERDTESVWQTVSTRKKKRSPTPVNGQTMEVDNDGRTSVTIDIGDFAPKIIGPKGETIRSLHQGTGASFELKKEEQTCTITGSPEEVKQAQDAIMGIIANQKKDLVDLGAKRPLVFAQIRQIQDATGARLSVEKGSNVMELNGEVGAVSKARSMIVTILNSTEVETVVLDSRDVSCVIGKQGANVRAIEKQSGATLDIDSAIGIISITGMSAEVKKARELIHLYVEHRGPPPEAMETSRMEDQDARLVIGPAGANVQKLQKDSGSRIKIKYSDEVDDGKGAQVIVSGSTAQVQAGLAAVKKLISDHGHEVKIPLESTNIIKAVLGTGGETIQNIREKSKAQVTLADSVVTCKGTKEQVDTAREMIEKIIKAEVGPPEVPDGYELYERDLGAATGKIIGSQGSNISRLQDVHGVTISVKRSTYCYVVGPPENVAAARKEIDDTVRRHDEMLAKAKTQQEEAAARLKQQEEEEEKSAAKDANPDDDDDDDDENDADDEDGGDETQSKQEKKKPAADAKKDEAIPAEGWAAVNGNGESQHQQTNGGNAEKWGDMNDLSEENGW